jgi:hypothetical protein
MQMSADYLTNDQVKFDDKNTQNQNLLPFQEQNMHSQHEAAPLCLLMLEHINFDQKHKGPAAKPNHQAHKKFIDGSSSRKH